MKKYALILPALFLAVGAFAAEIGGYLFVTFRGEGTPMTEQVYFMLSDDGRDWKALNDAEPVLVSELGEKGVRDPYIIRSHDNKKFYCIATDLSIHLTHHDWGRATRAASKCIVVWESEDLVNWSEPRLCRVAPDDAGCTWAPEAVYDVDQKKYMVFWASMTGRDDFSKHRIWAAYTGDFKTFEKPFIYIEKPTTVIDTTIIRENGVYYRFTKDEKHKAITMEKGDSIMGEWAEMDTFSLRHLEGYEGPTCFMISPPRGNRKAEWCLLLDWYAKGRGYQAYITDDLANGDFEEVDQDDRMEFPFHPVRHGTVLALTEEEYKRLRKADKDESFKVGGELVDQ